MNRKEGGSMKRSKKSSVKTVFTMCVLVCVIFGAFVYFSKREVEDHSEIIVEQTEAEKLLSKDITSEYPPTAREVIKLYSRIVKCIHGGEQLEEEQTTSLGKLMLNLYSEELLEKNPQDEYINNLLSEVEEYKSVDREVVSYAIDSGDNVIEWSDNGDNFSRILATFTLREATTYNKTCEEFVLIKNEEGQWKIHGWQLADIEDM